MKTISYNENINLKFTLTFSTINKMEMIDKNYFLEEKTHTYISQWYSYQIENGTITVFDVPVSEIESVIRIVNGFIK
jgi:hypothetical protein